MGGADGFCETALEAVNQGTRRQKVPPQRIGYRLDVIIIDGLPAIR